MQVQFSTIQYSTVECSQVQCCMQEVEDVSPGTRIVLSLKQTDAEFTDETIVRYEDVL